MTETEKKTKKLLLESKKVEGKRSKRWKYKSLTGEEMDEIGSFATVHGVAQTLPAFKQKHPQLTKQPTSDLKSNRKF